MKHLRIVQRLSALALACILTLGGHLGWQQWRGNFAIVVAGEVYRSNQPTPERLAAYVRDHGIRAVLNLRGAQPAADWYKAERKAVTDLGLTLIDLPLSAGRELTRDQAETLLATLRDAPKPLLIHCRSGADRTGLASVVYRAMLGRIDEEMAEQQLSIRYGHFSVPVLSAALPMDASWERMENWWAI
ncbi:dual specificity protein phosphatase family protein [Tabrizicola sp. YIM 78059]|uniref:dual specificity protein phosphatase family protein n=1 Tax=Tabrizicola sp. YIM 78059 TaxID=2529861 RepID=UPI0010A9DAFA|nr:dual specificity protein phosphatase family protein [Tabrizicola sp. YIM 78059]